MAPEANHFLVKRSGVICSLCGATETDKAWFMGKLVKAIKIETIRPLISGGRRVKIRKYCTCRAHAEPRVFSYDEPIIYKTQRRPALA